MASSSKNSKFTNRNAKKIADLRYDWENELRWNVWECLVPSGKIEKSESDKVQSMHQAPDLTYVSIPDNQQISKNG